MRTFFQTFTRIVNEDEVEVEYTFREGSPATRDDPGEGPDIEIVKTTNKETGKEVQTTEEEDDKFVQWIAENHEEDDYDDYE